MRYLAAVAVALFALPAHADTVILRNGASFDGLVTEAGDHVTVAMDFGSMTFRKCDVRSITLTRSPLQEFKERLNRVDESDIEGRLKLALWAKDQGLTQNARPLFEEIVRRDPENAVARAELGFERYENRWMTADEIHRAKGHVLEEGSWLTREQVADRRERAEQRRVEDSRKAEIARLNSQLAEQDRQLAEIRRQVEEAQRLREEEDRRRDAAIYWVIAQRSCMTGHRLPVIPPKKIIQPPPKRWANQPCPN